MQANRNDKFFNTAGGYVMNIEIANRLVNLRKQNSLSQEALADLAEIDRSHMGKIERGERNVTFLNILRIAKAMQCQPSDLLIDAGL